MPRAPARARGDPAERIVDEALDQADRVGWEALRLRLVAESLGIPLREVYRHYRDADAVAEAWLARADRAMLAAAGSWAALPPPERAREAILAWLDALAGHRRTTGRILLGKLYPGHPHHLAALVFRLSRTVQWIREAARLDAPPPRRQVEEIGLTWLFAATVALWAVDRSAGQVRTRRFLARRLADADRALGVLNRGRVPTSG